MGETARRDEHTGACLCGAVRYRVTGPLRPVISCHCSQCRRTSGHFVAATATRKANFELTEDRGLTWFDSSPEARRGFCKVCGSSLFWERHGDPHISIMAGTLDGPTGLETAMHICLADAGDYYTVADGTPQIDGPEHGMSVPDP